MSECYRIHTLSVLRNEIKMYNALKHEREEIIKDYEIKLQDEEEYHQEFEKFDKKVIYESKFYYEQPYRYVREKIQKDKVSLKNLYLQNGIY